MIHLLLAVAVTLPATVLWLILKMARHLKTGSLTLLIFLSGLLHLMPMVIVLAGDWVALIYQGPSELVGLTLLLAPVLISTLLYQRVLYRVVATPADTFCEFLWMRARVAFLVAVPLVLTLLTFTVAIWLFPRLEIGVASWTVLVSATLSITFSVYPFLFKIALGARKLKDGELLTRLLNLSRQAGVPLSDIVVIPATRVHTLNAWVSGIWPQHRIVFLTEGLISALTREELEAVFAHELGHVRKRHLWAYLTYAVSVTVVFAYLGVLLGGIFPSHPAVVPVRGAVMGLIALLGYAFLSRRLELSADRFAVTLTGNADAAVGALEKLAEARGLKGHRHAGRMSHPAWAATRCTVG